MSSSLPVKKRIKLDPSASPSESPSSDAEGQRKPQGDGSQSSVTLGKEDEERGPEIPMEVEEDEDEDHCVICLHHIQDRTVLPCAHDRLCFECILVWTAQSRKCPLCNAPIGPYLIHNLRSKYDYQKYYLPPLRTSPPPSLSTRQPLLRSGSNVHGRGRPQVPRWGTRARHRSASRERREMEDELELAVDRRRWVYRHGLYAKHVASNPYSRYRPAPTPGQLSTSPDLISRATIFVRRELRVWVNLDVEFLTTFILSLMKTLDLRSESAVKLLAEFLDMDTPYYVGDPEERPSGRFRNAEHFAHELYSYLRSPFRDLATYDSAVQYDTPSDVPPAPSQARDRLHQWDTRVRSPTQGEHSSRRSPSPITRSPRGAYSRSHSPTSSQPHEESRHYGPSPPPRSPIQEHSRPGTFTDAAGKGGDNRDRKGKGKELERPRGDPETRGRDELVARQHRSRRHSRSPRRSSVQPGSHREPFTTREKRRRPSSSDVSESSRRETRFSVNHEGRPEPPGDGQTASNVKLQPEEVPTTPKGEWGISIKGQAQRQAVMAEADRKESTQEHNSITPDPVIGVSKIRTRNPLSLDVLRAHLGHGTVALDISTHNALVGNGETNGPTKGHKNAVITQEPFDDISPRLRSNTDTQHSKSPPSPTPPVRPLSSQTSAPEIMARTRARLAQLRAQPPSDNLTSGAASHGSSREQVGEEAERTLSNIDMRARLVERLEQEKRQAPQSQEGHILSRSPKDPKGSRVISPESGVTQEIDSEGIATGMPSEAQQVENKLRAQALLRNRLAAEKRQVEVQLEKDSTVSREETLRAKLLSRRT